MKLVLNKQCTISGADQNTLNRIKQGLTMKNPAYIEAKKHGRWTGEIDKILHFYKDGKDGSLSFPRGFIREALDITGRYIVFQDNRRTLPEIDFKFTGELRPYQDKALQDVFKKDFGVLEAATGSGKTVIALAMIAVRKQPTLILVHSKLLLYQWRDRIRKFLNVEAGLIGDGQFSIKPITIAISNTAQKRPEIYEHFGQIVIDECSLVPSAMFSRVVQAFDCKYMLGLSATPYRCDGLTNLIYWFVGGLVHSIDLKELQNLRAVLIPKIYSRKTDFDYAKIITFMIENEERNSLIIRDIMRETRTRVGIALIVSDRIEHCKILSDLLKLASDKTLEVRILTGQIKKKERTLLVQDILADKVDVLMATVKILEKGFDCDGLSSLFLVTPIKFSGRLIQVVGRILRPADGKTPKVYDYQDRVFGSAKAREKTYREMGWFEPENTSKSQPVA